jgi:DNA-directed RNA polymerase subunit D
MTSEIPITAIEEVYIKENNSALQDEILAHRLGLIPIKGEGTIKLKVEGPKTVTSADLEHNGKVEIPNKEIPIIELLENQKIDLTAKVKEGTGKEHAKWQAAIVGYKYKNPKNIHLIIESCSYLTEKEILKKSLEILRNKAEKFKEEVSKYKSF